LCRYGMIYHNAQEKEKEKEKEEEEEEEIMMRRTAVAGLAGFFFLFNAYTVLANEGLYTDAIHVLKRMEEKTTAIKMCGASLLEKRKETKFIFDKIMETCACCSDAYYCCYTVDCKPCPEMNDKGQSSVKKSIELPFPAPLSEDRFQGDE
jgi:hypothetical protein